MLGRRTSISRGGARASPSSAMPPPPPPTSRATDMSVHDLSQLESLIQQAYFSPDVSMVDSAAFGFGSASSSSAVSQSTGSLQNATPPSNGTSAAHAFIGSASNEVTDPDFDSLLNLWTSPSTQTPLSSFSTSPALYSSPFSDHLSTPALDPLASFSSDIASASPAESYSNSFKLFDDLDSTTVLNLMAQVTEAQQLAATGKAAPSASGHVTSAATTVRPTELGLQLQTSAASILSMHSNWDNASASSEAEPTSSLSPQSLDSRGLPISPPPHNTTMSSSSKQKDHNGVRKGVQVRDLIPIDAPIQSRNYITPSATSRKDVPPSVARTFVPNSRKRSAQAAGLPSAEDMQDELAAEEDDPVTVERMRRRREVDPEKQALLDHVEQARRRNTLAARKSRQRKLEHVRTLEEVADSLQAENDALKKENQMYKEENEELKRKVKELMLQANLGGVPSGTESP